MAQIAMGQIAVEERTVDVSTKHLENRAAIFILLLESLNFGYKILYERSATGLGDVLLLLIVVALFFSSKQWLLRCTSWALVVLAVLLPMVWFPVFGDHVVEAKASTWVRLFEFFVAEIATLALAVFLARLVAKRRAK